MLLYQHNQESASSTWTIAHNLDLTAAAVDVYVDVNGTMTYILPANVTKTANQIIVEFSTPQVGFALIRGSTGMYIDYTGFVQPVERPIDYTHSPSINSAV